MTTFLIKKYEPKVHDTNQSPPVDTPAEQSKEQVVQISTSDSIAKIVAQALYKALPNVEIIEQQTQEQQEDKQGQDPGAQSAETNVVSTEQINQDPVKALEQVQHASNVLVLNEGFKTAKEEWFLQSLENRKVRTFYTVGSFVKFVQQQLG